MGPDLFLLSHSLIGQVDAVDLSFHAARHVIKDGKIDFLNFQNLARPK
jgi:hypothetical protein